MTNTQILRIIGMKRKCDRCGELALFDYVTQCRRPNSGVIDVQHEALCDRHTIQRLAGRVHDLESMQRRVAPLQPIMSTN
jgi:hypothetical protein